MVEREETRNGAAGEETVIRFPAGLPGFESETRWELVRREDVEPFLWLRSRGNPALALLVVDPRLLVPDYELRIPVHVAERVSASRLDGLLLLAVVTLREGGGATVNLRAPIVINPEEMTGVQVILDRRDLPLRHPIGVEEDGEKQDASPGTGGPEHAGAQQETR